MNCANGSEVRKKLVSLEVLRCWRRVLKVNLKDVPRSEDIEVGEGDELELPSNRNGNRLILPSYIFKSIPAHKIIYETQS